MHSIFITQGLAFRGNDESISSRNKRNFIELMNFLVNHNEDIYKVWKNCRGNLKLTSPGIQKDIVKVAATVTTQVILDDLEDDLFAILIDESHDILVKEKIVLVIHYVNNEGKVIKRFLGVVHVSNTSAQTLRSALELLFAKYGLSLSKIHGQGYDRASNMQGEYNGLKSSILKENCYAFFIHYFAHQLQLALVTLTKKHSKISLFFNLISNFYNVVGALCKR